MTRPELLQRLTTIEQQTAALDVIEYIATLLKTGKSWAECLSEINELKTEILEKDEEEL